MADVRPHGVRRGRHQGSEGRWEAMSALSPRPFCSCNGRQVSLEDLSAAYRDTTRCWGILELPWNGTKLIDAETMRGWAKKMTWKGLHPEAELSRKVYEQGPSRSVRRRCRRLKPD